MENTETPNKVSHNFTLDSFSKSQQTMIATNQNTYGKSSSYWDRLMTRQVYTEEEVADIIRSGNYLSQQKLSRDYFNRDGYYKQILVHYATLLKYAGLLIPNPSVGKNLSTSHIQKRYYSAMEYVENMHLPVFLTNCALRALTDGAYYGIILEGEKSQFSTMDLPAEYCMTRFKDMAGNDVIEFNLAYFNSITDKTTRKETLAVYPKVISKAYREWQAGKRTSQWFIIPSEIAICFPIFGGFPPFLSIIPAIQQYDDTVATIREKEKEEIKKIIVQKIPHLTDGRLLFEPDEAEEIHKGTVGMLKGNANLNVLTSYADVDAITSKTTADTTDTSLSKMKGNIYSQGSTSEQIFNAEGSVGLEAGLKVNISFMMMFANKAATYITNLINKKFANGNITFKYTILPISYHNDVKFAESAFKYVGSGYSLIMPALAFGLSQRDLVNIKDLENTLLKLNEKLIPPSTSYTQTANGDDGNEPGATGAPVETDINVGGRPNKEEGEKTETTIETQQSRN